MHSRVQSDSVPAGLPCFCPACAKEVPGFGPGLNGRPNAVCPSCGGLERHRTLALLLEGLAAYVHSASLVLEVAPSRATTQVLRRLAPGRLVRMDFDPGADKRDVDVQASLTDIPLPNGSVDLLICFHVLEHVPDDRAAMREIARVLRPGGIGLVQVPWRGEMPTDEDPSASPEERVARFGQADHVRWYGGDFDDRLSEAGLTAWRLTPALLFADPLQHMAIVADESVWLVRPGDASAIAATEPAAPFAPRSPIGVLSGQLTECDRRSEVSSRELAACRDALAQARRELAEATAQARHWKQTYRTLRQRLPVRVLARAGRVIRAVARPVKKS